MSQPMDHASFVRLLNEHRRLIHKVCWAYARTHDEREDLFQEIAIRLYQAAPGFDPSRKLSTWIYRVSLNVAIDFHRGRLRRSKVQSGLEADTQARESKDAATTDQLAELRELMERMSEADRALLLLHLEGHSHREIGEILGFGESNVGTRLHRIKSELRQSIENSTNQNG